MITVPPSSGLIPCDVCVRIVGSPAVRVAPLGPVDENGRILTLIPCCRRSTTDVDPNPPPGVTYASGTCGCMTTLGVGPVLSETGAVTQGGVCPAKKHVRVSIPSRFGFTSTMNPML